MFKKIENCSNLLTLKFGASKEVKIDSVIAKQDCCVNSTPLAPKFVILFSIGFSGVLCKLPKFKQRA